MSLPHTLWLPSCLLLRFPSATLPPVLHSSSTGRAVGGRFSHGRGGFTFLFWAYQAAACSDHLSGSCWTALRCHHLAPTPADGLFARRTCLPDACWACGAVRGMVLLVRCHPRRATSAHHCFSGYALLRLPECLERGGRFALLDALPVRLERGPLNAVRGCEMQLSALTLVSCGRPVPDSR